MQREKDFDLMVRSILENAEEQVPSGAWSCIRSRLSGTPAKAGNKWWWMLAPVACMLTAVILLNRPDSGIQQSGAPELVQAEAVPEGGQAEDIRLLPGDSDRTLALAAVPAPEKRSVSAKRHNVATTGHNVTTAEHSAAAAIPTNETAVPETSGQPVPAAVNSESTKSAAADTDAPTVAKESSAVSARPEDSVSAALNFNGTAFEEETGRTAMTRKFSFDAKGTAGGNGTNFIAGAGRDQYGYGIGSGSKQITETSESSYSVPFSIVLAGRMYLLPRLSIGTGISYSLLTRRFKGTYDNSTEKDIKHTMHYIGIPVDIQFDFLRLKLLNLFGSVGGQADYCVANRYDIGGQTVKDPVSGIQFSVNAGIGAEFKITKHFGIYLAPGVKYYFNCNQPKSLRTDRPFNFHLDGGFRFTL